MGGTFCAVRVRIRFVLGARRGGLRREGGRGGAGRVRVFERVPLLLWMSISWEV